MRGFSIAYGLAGAFVNCIWLLVLVFFAYGRLNFDQIEMIKYAFILISMAVTFFGVRAYRDRVLEGTITFASAFFSGVLMVFIISILYAATWVAAVNTSLPDYMTKYADFMIEKARAMGKSQSDIEKTMMEMEDYKLMVQNPWIFILICLSEIFPVGLVFSVLIAYLAKRSSRPLHYEDNMLQEL